MLNSNLSKFLEMGPVEFDQGEGGWRSLVRAENEEDIANLILEYADLNRKKIEEYNKNRGAAQSFPIGLLYFHAGQSFGFAGAEYYKKAIECFQKSYGEKNECWNTYVNGTISFLKGDKDGLQRQMKIIKNSGSEDKRSGNIGILKNFSSCLEQGVKDYKKAYSMPQSTRLTS